MRTCSFCGGGHGTPVGCNCDHVTTRTIGRDTETNHVEPGSNPHICIHGSLRRQCETCDLADRLEKVEKLAGEMKGLLEAQKYRDSFQCLKANNTQDCHCCCPNCAVEALLARPEVKALLPTTRDKEGGE